MLDEVVVTTLLEEEDADVVVVLTDEEEEVDEVRGAGKRVAHDAGISFGGLIPSAARTTFS